ncbi:unnamed protein product [Anisakis simplex]|uniref:Fibrous sheath-interacting protein 1 n=1 Tax=Anisakis simplex TaxID=6269 RepID=A0A0M3KBR5_ANISI|nr:unnamed protein product [Anisakis simplex]
MNELEDDGVRTSDGQRCSHGTDLEHSQVSGEKIQSPGSEMHLPMSPENKAEMNELCNGITTIDINAKPVTEDASNAVPKTQQATNEVSL